MKPTDAERLTLPPTFVPSRLAPTPAELDWLYDWLRQYATAERVLEFGCGITTWVLHAALAPRTYVAVEDWPHSVHDTSVHLPDVQIVTETWREIPRLEYELVFVDSSAGCPWGNRRGLYRVDAVQFAEDIMASDALVILHDWHGRSGRAARRYLEAHDYELLAGFHHRTGVGVYRKCSWNVS